MSMRYKGGVISATAPTTSSSAATGVWTLQQQFQCNIIISGDFNSTIGHLERNMRDSVKNAKIKPDSIAKIFPLKC